MASPALSHVLMRLRGILGRRDAAAHTDGHLLDLFLSRKDESAFELLLRRHGPMVLGVCRRVLGDEHAAEDAFQATFLVLVRRGERIHPRERVGRWLYGVAYRTALEARRAAARRRRREAQAMPREQSAEDGWSELRPLLDRELNALPERYRLPLLLCDLQGMTRREAAEQLGWAEGTLSSRLARARERLARRLKRHGIGLAAAAISGMLATQATASVSASLLNTTRTAALLAATGQMDSARLIAAEAVALAEKVVRDMGILKFKLVAALLMGAGVVAGLAYHGRAEQPATAEKARAAKAAEVAPAPARAADEKKEEKGPRVSVKQMPPVVVRTEPRAGDTKVDATKVKEIRATFSKDMQEQTWSWTQISDETFPKLDGKVHFEKDHRTCVVPVQLEPGKTYVLWLNSERFGNFKDAEGHSAVPYLLVFETLPKE